MLISQQIDLPLTIKYRTTGYAIGAFDSYVFEKNLQGDIVAIYNTSGTSVATYKYDAWGNVISATGTMASVNPFRYRGYYYDTETGFYYLRSRYYDPAICRFINADGYLYNHLQGLNLFAYCYNNPAMYVDYTGEEAEAIQSIWIVIGSVLSVIDGPLPIGETVLIITIGILFLTSGDTAQTDVAQNDANENDAPQNISDDDTNVDQNGRPVVKPGQQPTVEDGYIAPKGGPKWDKKQKGWIDKYGNTWVPAPTGSGLDHGGGHWDVQSPKGGYSNVYPKGRVVPKQKPYPRIPIF